MSIPSRQDAEPPTIRRLRARLAASQTLGEHAPCVSLPANGIVRTLGVHGQASRNGTRLFNVSETRLLLAGWEAIRHGAREIAHAG